MSKELEALERVWQDIGIDNNFREDFKDLDLIKQALINSQEQEKVLKIIKEKCIGTDNLFYVKVAEDYDDYLSLFEDKIEKQYLLTQEEFNLLKRWNNGL